MKKKILINILSILLFTLLLGCFTHTYATEFSENQLKNIAYNSLTNFGTNLMSETKSMLDTLDLSSVASKTYDYDYIYISMNIRDSESIPNANVYMVVYYSNDSSKYSTINSIRCKEYVRINFKNYSPVITWNTLNSETNIAQNGYDLDSWRFNDLDFYQTASGGSITLLNGWHPSNIDEAIYYDIQWNFSPRADGTATMNGDTTGRTFYLIDSIYQCNIGSITDSYMVDTYKYRIGTWNGSSYQFKAWKTAFKHRDGYYFPDYAPATSILNNNNSYTTTLYTDTNGQGNNIMQVVFTPIDSYKTYYNLEDIEVFYYITNNYSRISGGVIYPTKTFSGDYNNIYTNQENTNDIIGAVDQITQSENERDQWWRNAFNDLFTLNSGDAQTIINNFIENTELSDYGDYTIQEGILRTLEGNPQDFVISWRKCNNANTTEQINK